MDVLVKVTGGGTSGQAGAIRHGLSRALIKADESFKPALKKEKLLTRANRQARDKIVRKITKDIPKKTKRYSFNSYRYTAFI